MKAYYFIRMPLSIQPAIADLTQTQPGVFMINRINVPARFRNQGYGTKLLEMILEDADFENVVLILQVAPSGEMGPDELIAWYKRHGFDMIDQEQFLMRRKRRSLLSFEQKYGQKQHC